MNYFIILILILSGKISNAGLLKFIGKNCPSCFTNSDSQEDNSTRNRRNSQ